MNPPGDIAPVPELSTVLRLSDWLGTLRVRLGLRRSSYSIQPGLYRTGKPGPGSPVLVTANYKFTVDSLRRELAGLDTWILVADTKGVNVWCSAGKGTFSAKEVIRRMGKTDIARHVTARELILPQLSAPGVNANQIQRVTGWKTRFGPVRARDIPAFLENGRTASTAMRRVRFNLADRLVLIPRELIAGIPFALATFGLSILAAWIAARFGMRGNPLSKGLAMGTILVGAWLSGVALVPAFLPFIPSSWFTVKGALAGGVYGIIASMAFGATPWLIAASVVSSATISGKFAFDFTGSTTFTSLSGVERELRTMLPFGIASLAAAVAFAILGVVS